MGFLGLWQNFEDLGFGHMLWQRVTSINQTCTNEHAINVTESHAAV